MNRWLNKIAVVTGASSGIGSALVKDLIKENLIVVGLARHIENMEKFRNELPADCKKNFHILKCDVSKECEVETTFAWIKENLGGVDILVNNAGILKTGDLLTMDPQLVRDTLDTNIMGIVYCTRESFKTMKDREGHVILINSIAGHKIITPTPDSPSINIYPSSKYAVTAMNEIYQQEFRNLGTKVKVTSVSPGLTDTNIVPSEWRNLQDVGILRPEDISNAVIYALGTPPHVQISEITILPL